MVLLLPGPLAVLSYILSSGLLQAFDKGPWPRMSGDHILSVKLLRNAVARASLLISHLCMQGVNGAGSYTNSRISWRWAPPYPCKLHGKPCLPCLGRHYTWLCIPLMLLTCNRSTLTNWPCWRALTMANL